MNRILVAAAFAGFLALPSGAGALPFARADLGLGQVAEPVACVTRQVRTVRPNGRVVVRTVRECGRGMGMGRPMMERCRVVRERVERPNGTVVIRNVRRCR